ncbi:MAG: Rrf2 family transcriptional regulator [Pseudomonadota bacterium]
MKRNGRLALALHTLGHMAANPERLRTSGEIAEHSGTNAVVVRRVLAPLRDAGLVHSEKGHSGGWRLARAPTDISLADIYTALGETLVATAETPDITCETEQATFRRVTGVLDELEQTLLARLSATSLSDLA